MVTRRGRILRALCATAIFGAVVVGTFFGDDHHFPFGPMRMYSTTNEVDGPINSIILEGTTADGTTIRIKPNALGMRPAELDGQVPRFRADPSLLHYVLETYERTNPDAARVTSLRLSFGVTQLRDRKAVSYRQTVIAEWPDR